MSAPMKLTEAQRRINIMRRVHGDSAADMARIAWKVSHVVPHCDCSRCCMPWIDAGRAALKVGAK